MWVGQLIAKSVLSAVLLFGLTHGLLETRPDILPTENRVGEFWTYLDHVTLLNAFIGVPRMHGDDMTLFGKLLGEIWAFFASFCQ